MFPTSAGAAAVTAAPSQHPNSVVSGSSAPVAAQTQVVLFGGNQSEAQRELKDEIFRRQAQMAMANGVNLMPSDNELHETLPERVQDYTELYPLERPTMIGGKNLISNVFGFVTSIYRAVNINTSQTVCLRRVHSFQPLGLNQKSLIWLIESWKKIQCPTLVRLLQVFTTKEFGDTSLMFVYQYFPQSTTFLQQYFNNDPHTSGVAGQTNSIYGFSATNRPYSQQHAILKNRLLPENLLWHHIIQLSSALRVIHSLGFAFRILDPSKILITSQVPKCPPSQLMPSQYPRIRLNVCGLLDVVTHDLEAQQGRTNNIKEFYQQHQYDDLVALGQLCLALATNSLASAQRENWETALDLVNRTYSTELKALIVMLLFIKQQANRRSINDITHMIGARFYPQLNLAYEMLDTAQADLEQEALNGKLFRLIAKLSMINDRPELRLDPTWSETGDRYMLKLFREYLFHQVSEDGRPWLDCGHIVSTLVKFDAGSPEKICLISRDGQHVLVVSFSELKKCFESAFGELQA